MDGPLKQLQERTGLGVDQIKSVVSGVAGFLGDKLPGPIGDQRPSFLVATRTPPPPATTPVGSSRPNTPRRAPPPRITRRLPT